jgi:hypothetical protein
MKRKLFQEYLNSKKKLDKPVVSIDADRVDPMTSPNKPPKAEKAYKCSDGKPKKASEKGFAHMGEKNLVYKPCVDNECKGKAPAKIPTVEQYAIAFELVENVSQDPSVLESVVRQLKSSGLLGALVAEVLQHKEAHQHLAQILTDMNHGPKLWTELSRALGEEVAKPFAAEVEGTGDDDENNDQFTSDDDENEEGAPEENGEEPDVSMEDGQGDPNTMGDPSMMAGVDPSMMGGADPSMMMGGMPGMDPSMQGQMPPMDPSMMGGMQGQMPGQMPPMDPSMMGQMPPMNPMMAGMQKFQRAMMKAFMRSNMRRQMRKQMRRQ